MFEYYMDTYDKMSKILDNGNCRYYLREYVMKDETKQVSYGIRLETETNGRPLNREIKKITTDYDFAVKLFEALSCRIIKPADLDYEVRKFKLSQIKEPRYFWYGNESISFRVLYTPDMLEKFL